ncbi:hypothetical protein NDN08_005287 [Rhodosorus marinus]|uniref:Uncharacterized protein n=1 Tax=Rhodosorus marinus TaxID=101924 RepID=A0AAV8V419_9RHOD|nr:hypothetical protein NDN08_005287 [Rhodosorus marinus]
MDAFIRNVRLFGHGRRLCSSLSKRLADGKSVVGVYGGDHAVYHALAEAKTGRTLASLKGSAGTGGIKEWKVPALVKHIRKKAVQTRWNDIVSLDPHGLSSPRPTIAATMARMEIPELRDSLIPDGRVVNADQSVNCIKVAIEPVWDIPKLAKRLQVDEAVMRSHLAEWTLIDRLDDPEYDIFLPSIGGTTVYLFGDLQAIVDSKGKIAARPHDECNGSDVFGTDICTCRPYLVYAIQGAIERAQKGGCGIIAYFRKEGRAFGEVTKFRVYNLRRYQEGGDRPDMYFKMTEKIAGLVDARAQELMPDVFHWLGVKQIDELLSMSKDKHEAIVGAGINVVDRVSLPEEMVPKGAYVEISAKISSGYNNFQPRQTEEDKNRRELFTLECVRERCNKILSLGLDRELKHFHVDMKRLEPTVSRVVHTMKRKYPDFDIPTHSRWRQFEAGDVDRISELNQRWTRYNVDSLERTRRLVDLTAISVLLDAGAGKDWHYTDHHGGEEVFKRSEGLAIASLDMFQACNFSSDAGSPQVDAAALRKLSEDDLALAFQIRPDNPLIGLSGRYEMLQRLAKAMEANPQIFDNGEGVFRPGNLVDYVLREAHGQSSSVSIRVLWQAIMDGLQDVFPDSSGLHIGDAYRHYALHKKDSAPFHDVVPFHKLAQWLSYSLAEPFDQLGIRFVDSWLLTGLAEYRNGGLLVDMGMLKPKRPEEVFGKKLKVTDERVVEWRALTISLLDKLAVAIWDRLGESEQTMPMGRILEGGTWRAGREIAAEKRPGGLPPIEIDSTGDVF